MSDYQQMYDRMAPFYGIFWQWVKPWYRYTMAVLPELPEGGSVLEIGPGPGVLHEQLVDRYALVVGFDLSRGMLGKTHERLNQMGKSGRLVQGDATRLPFATACFDALTMTFVFSAIPDGPIAMSEFYRVLRPGGVLALVDAGEPDNKNRPGMWLARAWELFGDFMREEAALMQAAGFAVRKRKQFGAFDSIRLVVGQKPLDD